MDMSKKLLDLWTNFAAAGEPDPKWKPIDGESGEPGPAYVVLDNKDLRKEYPRQFAEDMAFLATVNALTHGYRNYEEEHHPAIQQLMAEREASSFDSVHDEF
jgi:hypothetical protein